MYFGAKWCPTCVQMKPAVQAVAKTYEVRLLDVDEPKAQQLANALEILTIPTVVVFEREHGGLTVKHISKGKMNEFELRRYMTEHQVDRRRR